MRFSTSSGAVSGASQTALSPVPKIERDKEEQPAAEAEETNMDLNETIARFRLGEGSMSSKRIQRKFAAGEKKPGSVDFRSLAQRRGQKQDDSERREQDQPPAERRKRKIAHKAKRGVKTKGRMGEAIGRFRRMNEAGKTAKKPGDPCTDKAQEKENKAAWEKMSPEEKKKYAGDKPMPSHGKCEDIDFDRPPVESIFTEQARLLSENDERDIAFAKSMLLDRVGLHRSVRQRLGEEEQDEEEEEQVSGARFGPHDLTRRAQNEANIAAKGGGSKSSFRGAYPGPQLPPEDEEAMAGVRGPGYGRDGRERVDVRTEAESAIAAGGMSTGALIVEEDAPRSRRRGRRRDRDNGPVTEDAHDPNFDPTKLRYPEELIGR